MCADFPERERNRALKLRPIVDLRRRRSRVREFCAWLRSPIIRDRMYVKPDPRPATPWMIALLLGVLAIGALIVRCSIGFPPVF